MGSTLSIWLTEAGFNKELIGTFALLGIPFSFKIIWTPFINQLCIPLFKDSPRKGWMFFALSGISFSLLAISFVDPALHPWALVGCLLTLAFFSSCLYIVGIAYELESLRDDQYGMGSFYVIAGYRLGLVCAGTGILYISYLWNWPIAFQCMAAFVLIGAIFVLIQPEPFKSKQILEEKRAAFAKYPSLLHGFWHETIYQPCRAFFQRSEWMIILLLLLTFKMGDHMAKSMEGPFYLSLGFNKAELAAASKLWGMAATIFGAFVAGYFVKGKDPLFVLALTGLIHACTLGLYYAFALIGKSMPFLYMSTAIGHFTGGISMTIFIFFLWKICDKSHAAVQYALLWSLFMMKSDLFSFFGGLIAAQVSWSTFFLSISIIGFASALLSFCIIYKRYYRLIPASNLTKPI